MLAAAHRMRHRAEFQAAVRRGRRAGGATLVVHYLRPDPRMSAPPRAGLVVGRSVGDAVRRNTVKRRIRHLLAERMPELPDAALVVVRALPTAADASSARLRHDLDRAFVRLGAAPDSAKVRASQ